MTNWNTQNVGAEFHEAAVLYDGRGWLVELWGAPGVWGSGKTLNEALNELPDVLRGWIEVGGQPKWPCVVNTQWTGNA
jgi:hypothetical protein